MRAMMPAAQLPPAVKGHRRVLLRRLQPHCAQRLGARCGHTRRILQLLKLAAALILAAARNGAEVAVGELDGDDADREQRERPIGAR